MNVCSTMKQWLTLKLRIKFRSLFDHCLRSGTALWTNMATFTKPHKDKPVFFCSSKERKEQCCTQQNLLLSRKHMTWCRWELNWWVALLWECGSGSRSQVFACVFEKSVCLWCATKSIFRRVIWHTPSSQSDVSLSITPSLTLPTMFQMCSFHLIWILLLFFWLDLNRWAVPINANVPDWLTQWWSFAIGQLNATWPSA